MNSKYAIAKSSTASLIPALAPIQALGAGLAYPLVRIAFGAFLMPHGGQKLFGWFGADPARIAGLFDKIGLAPGARWATIAGLVEFTCGLLITIGFLTRPAALGATVLLLVAVKVTSSGGWFWTTGGCEYALMWAIGTFSVLLQGGGRFSVDRAIGKEF